VRTLRGLLVLAAVYFGAAKLGLGLAFVHPSATAVWPPTGIALAALLVYGYRLWPGIALGAFAVNLITEGSAATSLGIATGNTLEAVLGTWLVRRHAGRPRVLASARNVFLFVVLAALASATVSATIGVTSLSLGRYAAWSQFDAVWCTWWLGDAAGALVVAPPLLLWSQDHGLRAPRRRCLHAAALGIVALATAMGVFWGLLPLGRNAPLSFVCIPVLIWAAFHFGARGAATITLLVSVCAVAGTLRGLGPFGLDPPQRSLLLQQAFMGTMSVLGLTLANVVAEARQGRAALQAAYEQLERRVAERTAELAEAQQDLIEISHREQQRLGQDLHDDLGQVLTGIAFLAKRASQKLAAAGRSEAEALTEICALVNAAIEKTRILARGLSAATVAEEGLGNALRELADNTARLFRVRCGFEQRGRPQNAAPWVEVHQYRIAQEAISNAIRHGKADRIDLVLSVDDGGTTLSVQDNGGGFRSDGGTGGLGMRIMKYRAGLIGGTIEIESTAAGSRVSCRVPSGVSPGTGA
jgi:signal transduction histidine kinase